MIRAFWSYLASFNESFKNGLNLVFLSKGCWSICSSDEPKFSPFTHVLFIPPKSLLTKFDQCGILIWQWNIDDLAGMFSALVRIPTTSALIVRTTCVTNYFEVNFHLEYSVSDTLTGFSTVNQLRQFIFGFDQMSTFQLKNQFSFQLDGHGLIIGEPHITGEKAEIMWVTITVANHLEQHQLIQYLISLALQMSDHLAIK